METHSKNTGFGGLSRRRCLAIWNSAAWRASKGGKSENSIAWEAVTAGKSENSLAWEAPTGGKSDNSLAWGAPTGGKSENSLAWGAPTGGKSENSLAWGAPTGGKSENSLAWGAPTGWKSENSLVWGAPTGGTRSGVNINIPWYSHYIPYISSKKKWWSSNFWPGFWPGFCTAHPHLDIFAQAIHGAKSILTQAAESLGCGLPHRAFRVLDGGIDPGKRGKSWEVHQDIWEIVDSNGFHQANLEMNQDFGILVENSDFYWKLVPCPYPSCETSW